MVETQCQLKTANEMKAAIAGEIYTSLQQLGAKSDLLRIVGSYGDTINDDMVLDLLREWNAGKP